MLDQHPASLEIEDVNHFDSRVFIRFADGRTVLLTGHEILEAAERKQKASRDESLTLAAEGGAQVN